MFKKYIKYILPGAFYIFINLYFLILSAGAWIVSYRPGLDSLVVTILRCLGLYIFLEVVTDSIKAVASVLVDIVEAQEDDALKEFQEKNSSKQKE